MALAAARAPSDLRQTAVGSSPGVSDFASPKSRWAAYEAALFVQALHGEGVGFARLLTVSSCGRVYNYHRPASEAAWAAQRHVGERDCYIGLNAYHRPRGPLAGIRTLHVDLDFYKVPRWTGADPRDVLAAALSALESSGIPFPGLAVATGRGLQLVWLVTPVKLRAAPKARAAMQRLTKLLGGFGADAACTDLARVFRLPGTLNSKTGTVARLLIHEPHRHDFDMLCRLILGERRAGYRKPNGSGPKATGNRALVHKRLSELQQIILGRWGGKVPKGVPEPRRPSGCGPSHPASRRRRG